MKNFQIFFPHRLPCHARRVDYFGSILSQCLEQNPQLCMIKLSGFPSPTVSVYELYLLILVSLRMNKERKRVEIVCIVMNGKHVDDAMMKKGKFGKICGDAGPKK